MSEQDRARWQLRYAEDSYRKTNPVTLLQQWLPRVTPGRALDVACGAGRNAIFAAAQGFRVDAIDISANGLALGRRNAEALGLDINWIEHDLDEAYDFAAGYSLIIVLWYVDLELITRLCDCLAPGGYLISEQHLRTDAEVIGPENNEFRVAPGALRAALAGLDIVDYAETVATVEDGQLLASARAVATNTR